MKTSSLLFVFILVLIGVGGGWYFISQRGGEVIAPTVSPTPVATPSPSPSPTPKVSPKVSPTPTPFTDEAILIISMVPSGFLRSEITIPKGTKVSFINNDTKNRWPASGVHPVHTLCPGFDSKRPLAPGEAYSFTFNFDPPKVCSFHDHLFPTLTGKITIQ